MTTPLPALAGLRVVEVGNFMAVPFCGMQLADLGAEVLKVENPRGGDLTRAAGPFIDGESSNFVRLNRNKRSVALDLKSPDGKALFRRLVASADVVIENLRPGTMDGLGLGYEALRADDPRLIYLAATGFGNDGPYAHLAGLDIIAQGMSGLMSITGEPDRPPAKVGVPIADLTCALYATIAVLAALRARDRDGLGQFIDVSLLESAVSFAVWEAGRWFATGELPRPSGSAHQAVAPYQAFRTADGYLTFGANSQAHWLRACEVLGLEALANDERFADNDRRLAHRAELAAAIEAVTTTRPSAHWSERFGAAGIPCGPIWTFDRVFNDPHLTGRGFFADAPHPTLGPVRQLGSPMRLSRTPARMDRAGPQLGADTADVLREIGVDEAEIARLARDGVTVPA
ncbi:MAG TPA: CoA transferase [Candidatus Limnocylindria bacterium]|jgi:crotonobetainyl-CoA:carnitine CoA-transferase CaiB-like acyl-CoA transferase|nr:CoA transferase [Candidatus Limnocylindria bacterium]